MDQRIRLSSGHPRPWLVSSRAIAFRILTRFPDLFVIPWVLEEGQVYVYLTARGISLCLPLGLHVLGKKARPQLKELSQSRIAFQAAAGRVNLGYLMVCGAMALLVVGLQPYIGGMIGYHEAGFSAILAWLVIGQSSSVLFGATALLMQVMDRGSFYEGLSVVTSIMFLMAVVLTDTMNSTAIAQAIAAAQLAQAAICAVLLTQCGVWPGLTALLHKQIKLF